MESGSHPSTAPGPGAPRPEIASYPQRIACLTGETTETLYLLGEGDRGGGVSGYSVRPTEARTKPKVSAFVSARYDKILAQAVGAVVEPWLQPQARLDGDLGGPEG